MSTFQFICPFCDHDLDCDQTLHNQEIKCPVCKHEIVPVNDAPGIADAQPSPQKRKSAISLLYPGGKKPFGWQSLCSPHTINCHAAQLSAAPLWGRKLFLGLAVVVIVIGLVIISKSAKRQTPPTVQQVNKPAQLDPFAAKYGISQEQAEIFAGLLAEAAARRYFNLSSGADFFWRSSSYYVFEFEKRDANFNPIGKWIGVNVKNQTQINGLTYQCAGTFHYDPVAVKWFCNSFNVDRKH